MRSDNQADFVIPARPEILLQVTAEIRKETPCFNTIAHIMMGDVSLYANVLAIINTPFFGMRERVTSMQNAVSLLGVNRVYSIVRMAALRNSLKTIGRMDRFWDSSTEVATICGHVRRFIPCLSKDDAYTMGMMHDCGIPLMMNNFKDYRSFFESRNGLDLPQLHQQEQEHYAIDHFELSSAIAQAWSIPEQICHAIRLQPYAEEVLESGRYEDTLCNTLCLLLVSKELSEKFRSLWSVDEDQRPVMPMEPILEYLGICDHDLVDIRDDVFSRLELSDNGIVPA